jgi:type III restriction enzyme
MYAENAALQTVLTSGYVSLLTQEEPYKNWIDRPETGTGKLYPRVCVKMPTGGGKTRIAIESIRAFQNHFKKQRTGLVVWIAHRESIYRQTIENLQNKGHIYRQLLDQTSGNRTLILEKGQALRRQDIEENLVVLMLMIDSAKRADTNKMFEDSGGYADFFPPDSRYDEHAQLLEKVSNLDHFDDSLFSRKLVKTSLGNVIRTQEPLIIVDEFHAMFTPKAQLTLDGLNPALILGLSATPPKSGMNILVSVNGQELKNEEMIKLPLRVIGPSGEYTEMLAQVKSKRGALEKQAQAHLANNGMYIRPIALIQAERTGKEQRGQGFVHSEDVRDALLALGIPRHEIGVKSSTLDEIKHEKLLSRDCEIRYIITKEALKEGWDCPFAYVLGVIPNAQSNNSMTQLVGRILRQPYAKATGVVDLDQSYVFYTQSATGDVLDRVRAGLQEEGLGDLAREISMETTEGTAVAERAPARIRKDIADTYAHSLYLPVWLTKEENDTYRRFSYTVDVEAKIVWESLIFTDWLAVISPTIGKQQHLYQETMVDLDNVVKTVESTQIATVTFTMDYLARRVNETVKNAFVSYEIAAKIHHMLSKDREAKELDRNAGYIAEELEKCLLRYRKDQEKTIFEELHDSGQLILAVSADSTLGYSMPESDGAMADIGLHNAKSLYHGYDTTSGLNTLEQNVVRITESSPNVLWWSRNQPVRGYAIQGWQKNRIWPDFIIARKSESGELEFVYVVESKGEQLLGSEDTKYKNEVLTLMNGKKGAIAHVDGAMMKMRMNDVFEFELVPEKQADQWLRAKL